MLAAAVAAFNTVSETPLGRVEQACLLAGFLSYKVTSLMPLHICEHNAWGGSLKISQRCL